ncbi:hypothetical protein evm_010891 [Chilo suppressalis]|nr:hypothetical protein evm_010891 [Chilo suppressalis]
MNLLHICVAYIVIFTHALATKIRKTYDILKNERNFNIKPYINNKTIRTRPLNDNEQLDDLLESLKQHTIQSTKNISSGTVKHRLDEYVMKRKMTHLNLIGDTNIKINRNVKQAKVNNEEVSDHDYFRERSVSSSFYEDPNVLSVLNTQKVLPNKINEHAKRSVIYYNKNNEELINRNPFKETVEHRPFHKETEYYKMPRTERDLTKKVQYEDKSDNEKNDNLNSINVAADYLPFYADPKVFNLLNTQTELMENLMRVMEDERRSVRSYDSDFKEMLEDLENKNATEINPDDMNQRITTKKSVKPVQDILQATGIFDRPRIFAALKKDPLVRRIIAMADLKRKQFFEKLSALSTTKKV